MRRMQCSEEDEEVGEEKGEEDEEKSEEDEKEGEGGCTAVRRMRRRVTSMRRRV